MKMGLNFASYHEKVEIPCLSGWPDAIYDTYFVCNETYEIEMGPIPLEECPECQIPEGTRCGGNKYSQDEKIVNGVETVPHSWPWIARFQMDGQAGCAGSIINKVSA